MNNVYLGLGSNLGNRREILNRAIEEINERIGKVISLSVFYETAPWGYESVHPFLNAVACVESDRLPLQILDITQQIEKEMGRVHKSDGHYSDRTLDIDLLIIDDIVMNTPRLTLPHPLLHQRRFVLEPLAEIAPGLFHPVLKKKIFELLKFV